MVIYHHQLNGHESDQTLVRQWASLVAQLVKTLPAMQEICVWSLGREDSWRRETLPTPVFWPGEFHSPGVHKELDTTEWLSLSLFTGTQWRREEPGTLQSMGLQSQTWLNNWTTTTRTLRSVQTTSWQRVVDLTCPWGKTINKCFLSHVVANLLILFSNWNLKRIHLPN